MYHPAKEEIIELTDSEYEIFVAIFIGSVILNFTAWPNWYHDAISVEHLRVPTRRSSALLVTPIICLLVVLLTLKTLADASVRGDLQYIGFYLLMGAACIGGATFLFPLLGISARDDVLERHNGAAACAIAGALGGVTCAFAGGNIGNGPGAHAVLLSVALSIGLFFLLWFVLEAVTSIADVITIDRDKGAGIRLGGLLIGIGVLSGWSVTGDWVSASATFEDFSRSLWPAVALTLAAIVFELLARGGEKNRLVGNAWSVIVSGVYVSVAGTWVGMRGVH
jgi:hypothetical protein